MADAPPPLADPLIGRTLGHFVVRRRLGAGGMGVVYLAEDSSLRREVALKVLPPALMEDAERRRRFLREARTAASVHHPGIATIFEVGESEAAVFLAMEFVQGESLRARLQRGPLDVAATLRIGAEIARALECAHGAGIVHRDIKPDNVMIRPDGQVKLLDFGIARVAARASRAAPEGQDGPTATEMTLAEVGVVGTPGYMSPEQATGGSVDHRSDQFALGVLLWEALAGRCPFAGPTPIAMIVAVARDTPDAIQTVRFGVPDALAGIIDRCLAKSPADRWSETRELREALEAARAEPRAALSGRTTAPTLEFHSPGTVESSDSGAPVPVRLAGGPRPTPVGTAPEPDAYSPTLEVSPQSADGSHLEARSGPTTGGAARPGEPAVSHAAPPGGRAHRGGAWSGISIAAATVFVGALLAMDEWLRPGDAVVSSNASGEGGADASRAGSGTPGTPPVALPSYRERAVTANPPSILTSACAIRADGSVVAWLDSRGLWEQALPVGEPLPIPLPEGFSPSGVSYGPAGARLLGGRWTESGEAGLVRIDGSGHSTELCRSRGVPAAVTGDGREALTLTADALAVLDVATCREVELMLVTAEETYTAFAWAPSGERLAAIRTASSATGSQQELLVIAADGSQTTRLADGAGLVMPRAGAGVAWLDEETVLFARTDAADGEEGAAILAVRVDEPADSRRAERIHFVPHAGIGSLAASEETQRIAFVAVRAQMDVYLARIQDGGPAIGPLERLTQDDREDRPTDWTPDGAVLFDSTRLGSWDVYRQALGDLSARAVASGPGVQSWGRAFGAEVLYWDMAVSEVDSSGIATLRVTSAGGEVRALWTADAERISFIGGRPPPGSVQVRCARELPDRCVLMWSEANGRRFARLDPSTGIAGDVFYEHGATDFPLEWDIDGGGDRIAIARSDETVTFVDVGSSGTRTIRLRLPGATVRVQYVAWDATGEGVYATAMAQVPTSYDLIWLSEEGEQRELWHSDAVWIAQPNVSWDGGWLAAGLLPFDADVHWLDPTVPEAR